MVAPDMRQFTGYLMRRAYVKSAGVARACVPDETTVREAAFLSVLSEQGPLSQRALADLTHVSPTLVVKLIDALEAKRWVVRERSDSDRRSYSIRLTDEGERALVSLTHDLDAGEAMLTEALTPTEVARLRGHLKVLLDGESVLEAGSLADRTGYLITHAHHRLRSVAQEALDEYQLHPRDFGLLTIIGRDEPCSQNHVASKLGITPPAVLVFIEDLEQRGILSRIRSESDRRVYEVRLTTQGRQILAKARQAAKGVQREIADILGPEADADLRALLTKLLT